jgi:hypothetical protein
MKHQRCKCERSGQQGGAGGGGLEVHPRHPLVVDLEYKVEASKENATKHQPELHTLYQKMHQRMHFQLQMSKEQLVHLQEEQEQEAAVLVCCMTGAQCGFYGIYPQKRR